MAVTIEIKEDFLTAYLSGELDHHTVKEIREAIDRDIVQSKPSQLVLDFRGVTFMDSSGIGLVMGRYKLMEEIGGTVLLTNLPSLKKVMKLAGMDRLAQIKD